MNHCVAQDASERSRRSALKPEIKTGVKQMIEREEETFRGIEEYKDCAGYFA